MTSLKPTIFELHGPSRSLMSVHMESLSAELVMMSVKSVQAYLQPFSC